MNIVELYTGTNIKNGTKLINKQFRPISWWSDNYETIEHYYEGCVIKIEVNLDERLRQDYIRSVEESKPNYTYGFDEMLVPEGATWYSFSESYLINNLVSVEEVNIKDLKEILQ